MSSKPRVRCQATVSVKGHDRKKRSGKATTYTAIMRTKKGEELGVEVKLTVKNNSLEQDFPMQDEMIVLLVNPNTKLDEFFEMPEGSEEAASETETDDLTDIEDD